MPIKPRGGFGFLRPRRTSHIALARLAAVTVGLLLPGTVALAQSSDRPSSARQRTLGLGVALINPSGLSLKYRLDASRSIEGAVGWSRQWVHLHVQYLADEMILAQNQDFVFAFNYGAGLQVVGGRKSPALGVRLPAGVVANFSRVPLDFFAQVGLLVGVVPETSVGIDLTLGGRYYF